MHLTGQCYTGAGDRDVLRISDWKERLRTDQRLAKRFNAVGIDELRLGQEGQQAYASTSFAVSCLTKTEP